MNRILVAKIIERSSVNMNRLVVNFSVTGVTAKLAIILVEMVDMDLHKLQLCCSLLPVEVDLEIPLKNWRIAAEGLF